MECNFDVGDLVKSIYSGVIVKVEKIRLSSGGFDGKIIDTGGDEMYEVGRMSTSWNLYAFELFKKESSFWEV